MKVTSTGTPDTQPAASPLARCVTPDKSPNLSGLPLLSTGATRLIQLLGLVSDRLHVGCAEGASCPPHPTSDSGDLMRASSSGPARQTPWRASAGAGGHSLRPRSPGRPGLPCAQPISQMDTQRLREGERPVRSCGVEPSRGCRRPRAQLSPPGLPGAEGLRVVCLGGDHPPSTPGRGTVLWGEAQRSPGAQHGPGLGSELPA